MNAYERRARERKLAAAARNEVYRDRRQADRLLAANQLAKRYEDVYMQFHQRPIKVTYSRGWFTAHNRKVRADKLERMIRNLEGILHEQKLLHPEEQ